MPAPYNLTIWQGDDKALPITFQSGGAALDVSAYTFSAKIADDYGGTAVATFAVATGSAASGEITLSLTSTSTAALTLTSTYVWDFQQVVNSTTTTLLYGRANIKGQVTT